MVKLIPINGERRVYFSKTWTFCNSEHNVLLSIINLGKGLIPVEMENSEIPNPDLCFSCSLRIRVCESKEELSSFFFIFWCVREKIPIKTDQKASILWKHEMLNVKITHIHAQNTDGKSLILWPSKELIIQNRNQHPFSTMARGSIISGIKPEGRSLIISIAMAMMAVAAVSERHCTCNSALIMSSSYPLLPSSQYFRRTGLETQAWKVTKPSRIFLNVMFIIKDTGKQFNKYLHVY